MNHIRKFNESKKDVIVYKTYQENLNVGKIQPGWDMSQSKNYELPSESEIENATNMFSFLLIPDIKQKLITRDSNSTNIQWYNIVRDKKIGGKPLPECIQFYKLEDNWYSIGIIYLDKYDFTEYYLCDGMEGVEMLSKIKKGEVESKEGQTEWYI